MLWFKSSVSQGDVAKEENKLFRIILQAYLLAFSTIRMQLQSGETISKQNIVKSSASYDK